MNVPFVDELATPVWCFVMSLGSGPEAPRILPDNLQVASGFEHYFPHIYVRSIAMLHRVLLSF